MVNAISVNISQNRKFLICAWLINRNSNSDVERSKDLVNVKKKKKEKTGSLNLYLLALKTKFCFWLFIMKRKKKIPRFLKMGFRYSFFLSFSPFFFFFTRLRKK